MELTRKLRVLCIQLGFHQDYRDAGALASTYNDGIYYIASFLQTEFPGISIDVCQMFWGETPAEYPLEQYDYFLISSLASTFGANFAALDTIKARRKPGARIVFGGAHASFAPHEVL